MLSLSEAMRVRFQSAFDASKYNSLRQLSKDAKCNPAQAGKIVRGEFESTRAGPGLFGMWRMAEKMGVGLTDLLPPASGQSRRPGVAKFFAQYDRRSPNIHNFRNILEFCDIYEEPKNGRCKLISMGPKSLLAEKTEITDVAIQQAEFDSWSPERRAKIFAWQRRAWEAGALAEPEDFTGDYRAVDRNFHLLILRAACRVIGDDLKPRLLIYCDQIWQESGHIEHRGRQAVSA